MSKLKIAQDLLDIIYPVGSVYLTINDINPQTLFGGTWVKMYGGYLYGAQNSIEQTSFNGWGTQSTALNVNQMPSHNHTITIDKKTLTGNLNSMYGSSGVSPLRDNCRVDGVFSRNGTTTVNTPGYTAVKGYGLHIDVSHNHGASSGKTGGNQGHTHDIATIDVFAWKRTA